MSTCQSYTLRRIAWILCLLYAPAAVAQNPTSQPVDVYDSAYFLWETQIGKSHVVLFGTFHGGKKSLYPFPKPYEKAFARADTVAFEIEETYEQAEKAFLQCCENSRVEPGKRLSKQLTAEQIKLCKRIVGDEEFTALDSYKPVVMMLTVISESMRLADYAPELAPDFVFKDRALKAGKRVVGLETIEEELAALEFSRPYDQQLETLKAIVNEKTLEAIAKEIARIAKPYYANHIVSFRKMHPQLPEKLGVERNRRWVKRLEKMSAERPGEYLVVVGAGHLLSPKGNVLQLLQKKGYVVHPVVAGANTEKNKEGEGK
ncbi:TraB/GumN family protein [Planctomycetota bacterium]